MPFLIQWIMDGKRIMGDMFQFGMRLKCFLSLKSQSLIKTTNKNFEMKNNNEESIYSDSAASDCDSDWSVDANEDGDFH